MRHRPSWRTPTVSYTMTGSWQQTEQSVTSDRTEWCLTTRTRTLDRCNNSKQSHPKQRYRWEVAEVHRLERRAHKNMATKNVLYNTISTIHNAYYSKQLHESLILPNLRPTLNIPTQKAVIFHTWLLFREFLADPWIRSAWSMRPRTI